MLANKKGDEMKVIYCKNFEEVYRIKEMIHDVLESEDSTFEISDLFGLTYDYLNIRAEVVSKLYVQNIVSRTILLAKNNLQNNNVFNLFYDKVDLLEVIASDEFEVVSIYDSNEVFEEYESMIENYTNETEIEFRFPLESDR